MIQTFARDAKYLKGYSSNTANGYAKDLTDFAKYASKHIQNARWSTITKEDIEKYVRTMSEDGKSPATIARKISALRSFYNWAKSKGKIDHNPARYVTTPKKGKRLPNIITPSEIIATVNDETIDRRTRTQILLLYTTGMRLQEMLDLKPENINPQDMSIRITGKGNKERIIYYSHATAQYLREYTNTSPGPIFDETQRNVRWNIWHALRKHSQAQQLSPHALRHSYATTLINNGAPITTVQKLLGHEDVKTTQIYTEIAQPTVRNDYNKNKPL